MFMEFLTSLWHFIKWFLRGLGSLLLWVVDKIMILVWGILDMITDILVAIDFTGILADLFDKKDKVE